MARELYETEAAFRADVDACCAALVPHLGWDLRDVLTAEPTAEAAARLKETGVAQPALFVVEYALARVWMRWGVRPAALIGHSIGEYVAACVAGVFSLEDALRVVAERGRLMQSMPGGAMLMAPLPEQELRPLLGIDQHFERAVGQRARAEAHVELAVDHAVAAIPDGGELV